MKIKEKEGLTFEETASRFQISIVTLFRWQQRIEPQTTHKKISRKIDLKALVDNVKKYPDWYQRERARYFGVSQSAISGALKELNISHKRKKNHPKADDRLRAKS